MTKQEIFDKVSEHLLTQNRKAETLQHECKYRAGDLKCAVGCLIPDDKYSSQIEKASVSHLVRGLGHTYLLPEDMSESGGINFLVDLQRIHDDDYPSYWPRYLHSFARRHGLEVKRKLLEVSI